MATTTVTLVTPAAPRPPGQPDISYAPDYDKWQARVARRLAAGNLPKSLPEGFPSKLSGDLVWEGQSIADEYDWTYVLSEDQLAEIDRAVEHFKGLKLPLGALSPETFPLPSLHAELRRLSDELHNGHGFFVLRGLRVDEHSREENVMIYAGVSSHVAPVRGRQDHKFEGRDADVVLSHIKDLSGARQAGGGGGGVIGSPAYTTDKQVFHTDSGDIVSLFALGTAAAGGKSRIASTWRVYNEIAATRPDLIHTLSQDWPMEIFGKGPNQYRWRPLLHHYAATATAPERVALQYARRSFVGFGALPRSAGIPAISEAQAEALDTLHFLGERFSLDTDFQKGDVQYVNNLALFHARDGFADTPETQRHLLRLWLRDPENAWETPEVLRWRWAELYEGLTPESQVLPLEPFVRSASHKKAN
ncbi:TfdA family taurine catabolism dioxygenase TauD [Biscogniauxia mediterranea]|nr:TfdA family taurine catabolism dioxygenase TauD [Biscogniauxia mediterranea]